MSTSIFFFFPVQSASVMNSYIYREVHIGLQQRLQKLNVSVPVLHYHQTHFFTEVLCTLLSQLNNVLVAANTLNVKKPKCC